MIELMVRRYLAEALSVPVHMEMPEHPPDALVLVEKTGSSETDHIRRATLAVQSYAPSLAEAARLNEQVKEQLGRMPAAEQVFAVRVVSDYNYTDTNTKRYRYQAVVEAVY